MLLGLGEAAHGPSDLAWALKQGEPTLVPGPPKSLSLPWVLPPSKATRGTGDLFSNRSVLVTHL